MKKKALWIIGIVLVLAVAFCVVHGFMKNTSAFIADYTLSPDGREMTIRVSVSSSAGYIRAVRVHQQQGGRLYLDCYSAFGGVNGHIGAKDTFTVYLNEDTSVVALYRNSNCYEEVLVKAADGSWQRAQP